MWSAKWSRTRMASRSILIFASGGGFLAGHAEVCAAPRARDRLAIRTWKHVPLWGLKVRLYYAPARVTCSHCGKVLVEAIPWSRGKCRLSTGLIWLLASLCKLLPWDQVAKLFSVHWNTDSTAVGQPRRRRGSSTGRWAWCSTSALTSCHGARDTCTSPTCTTSRTNVCSGPAKAAARTPCARSLPSTERPLNKG